MKKLLLTISLILAFICPVEACEHEDVYVVDLELSEFTGKLIGMQFQCIDEEPHRFKLYNRNTASKPIYLGEDSKFIVMEVEGKETLTLIKGINNGNEFKNKKR